MSAHPRISAGSAEPTAMTARASGRGPIRAAPNDGIRAAILMAFWHRTRHEIVPLTLREIAAKVSRSDHGIRYQLSALRDLGWIESRMAYSEGVQISTFAPTERAADLIRRAVAARADGRRGA